MYRIGSAIKLRNLLTGILLAIIITYLPGCSESKAENEQILEITANLEKLAKELSIYVADAESRKFLVSQIQKFPKKSSVVLQHFLGKASQETNNAKQEEVFWRMMSEVEQTENMMRNYGANIPRIDLDVPVKAHRDLLETADKLYIAVSPLIDERDVKSIVGFSNGERITFSPDKAPEILTLVIKPAEYEYFDPEYPLEFSEETTDDEKSNRIVDEMIGIFRILITNDHESWVDGDPEIYVKIRRVETICPCHPRNLVIRINLPGVNDEHKWYTLGDPNATYRFVGSGTHSRFIEFEFWEDDDWPAPSPFSDDFLGSIRVNWTSLPFSGFTQFNSATAEVLVKVDKD